MIDAADRRFKRRRRTSEDELVGELAEQFEVSREAVEYRLANLGVWGPL